MLKRDIGAHWLATGQRVSLVSKYFTGKTGLIVGCYWITGDYLVRMDETGHILPFRECELYSCD